MAAIRHLASGTVLADQVVVARGGWQRMIGLLSRVSFSDGEAMVFPRCHAIHTCFMRFSIDVIFLRTVQGSGFGVGGVVVKIVHQLFPFRFAMTWGADTVVELPAGACERAGLQRGELLEIA